MIPASPNDSAGQLRRPLSAVALAGAARAGAHLLIHASRMAGGAHMIMEAVASGTPVLASGIEGKVGMLGADYAGHFRWGDADALAALILRCHRSRNLPPDDNLPRTLARQCALRAPLFAPAAERGALQSLVAALLGAR